MPITLHPHLKRGLILEHDEPNSEDLLEHLSPDSVVTEQDARKRQRIERIAVSYLRGKPPLILSAGLRGPFDHGWKNPWATVRFTKERPARRNEGKGKQESQRMKKGKRRGVRETLGTNAQLETDTRSVASPEASRAVGHDLESYNQTCTLEDDNNIPLTAPSPAIQTQSDAANLFSTASEQHLRRSSLTNPFWLRKPASTNASDRHRTKTSTSDASPLRTCDAAYSPTSTLELHLAQPKAPIGSLSKTIHEEASNDRTITSSAPMVISSPVAPKITTLVKASAPSDTCNTAHIDTLTTHTVSTPSTAAQASSLTVAIDKNTVEVTSQMSNESKGSSHRKLGSARWTIKNAPRSKPRPVNFNSSPMVKNDKFATKHTESMKSNDHLSAKSPTQDDRGTEENDEPVSTLEAAYVSSPGQKPDASTGPVARRESQYSTQAAMLLAQIEFHESTYPTSSDISRPWSHGESVTPRKSLPEPSPAMTPFSVFKPQLQSPQPPDSMFRGPAMSTQDLFAAASPFAFSTIKKKTEVLVPNSMKMTTTTQRIKFAVHDHTPRSATRKTGQQSPSDKIAAATPWSHVQREGPSIDMELPQLDFHTSLDDYGQLNSSNSADRVLRNLSET